ncbi:MAG: hypothetical protein L3K04_03115 [Thermoplasmata archaeon]|nr:hypothetical protein [Thermoplasmata archaeon]
MLLLLLVILVTGIAFPLLMAGLGWVLHAPPYPSSNSSPPPANNSTTNSSEAWGTSALAPSVGAPHTASVSARAPGTDAPPVRTFVSPGGLGSERAAPMGGRVAPLVAGTASGGG